MIIITGYKVFIDYHLTDGPTVTKEIGFSAFEKPIHVFFGDTVSFTANFSLDLQDANAKAASSRDVTKVLDEIRQLLADKTLRRKQRIINVQLLINEYLESTKL